MEMPDEKQSGIYGYQNKLGLEDDVVESLALDDNTSSRVLNPAGSQLSLGGGGNKPVQMKLIGPNMMRQKIKENLEDRKADPKRPSSQMKKQ